MAITASVAEIDWLVDNEELARINRMFMHEKSLWQTGARFVAGIDEAGRGPLAGPVVAAAVVFEDNPQIPYVNDSKKISGKIRDQLFDRIKLAALSYGIGVVSVEEIDRVNIYQGAFLAMQRALEQLHPRPDHLLVDGRAYPESDYAVTTLVKGDSLSYSIAAASILAKVHRDSLMIDYDARFPQYGFARHKGYATAEHLDAIEANGYCPIHRRSFHPKRFQLCLDLRD